MSQTLLAQVLRQFPSRVDDPNVIVGSHSFDDAGIYRLRRDCALVQTVDFFTPIVDDPFDFGQIAAANALSDVYAMGGRPLTALNLLGVPTETITPDIIAQILRGGARKAAEAGCALIGGHTIRNPEPIYGLSVTGIVHPKRILTNAAAHVGDLLVLTKPLGTGIASTAIKRGIAPPALARRAINIMKQLNVAGATLAERGLIKAATDVTGFGLLGHLANILRASGVSAQLHARSIPILHRSIWKLIEQDCVPGGTIANLKSIEDITDWSDTPDAARVVLTDAQTSGGLLLCVAPQNLTAVMKVLRSHRTPAAAVIGSITRSRRPRILVQP